MPTASKEELQSFAVDLQGDITTDALNDIALNFVSPYSPTIVLPQGEHYLLSSDRPFPELIKADTAVLALDATNIVAWIAKADADKIQALAIERINPEGANPLEKTDVPMGACLASLLSANINVARLYIKAENSNIDKLGVSTLIEVTPAAERLDSLESIEGLADAMLDHALGPIDQSAFASLINDDQREEYMEDIQSVIDELSEDPASSNDVALYAQKITEVLSLNLLQSLNAQATLGDEPEDQYLIGYRKAMLGGLDIQQVTPDRLEQWVESACKNQRIQAMALNIAQEIVAQKERAQSPDGGLSDAEPDAAVKSESFMSKLLALANGLWESIKSLFLSNVVADVQGKASGYSQAEETREEEHFSGLLQEGDKTAESSVNPDDEVPGHFTEVSVKASSQRGPSSPNH